MAKLPRPVAEVPPAPATPPRTEIAPPREATVCPCKPAGEDVLTTPRPTGEGPLGATIRTPGVPEDVGVLTTPDGLNLGVPTGGGPSKPGEGVLIWPPAVGIGLTPPTAVGVTARGAELTAGLDPTAVVMAFPPGLTLETTGIAAEVPDDC